MSVFQKLIAGLSGITLLLCASVVLAAESAVYVQDSNGQVVIEAEQFHASSAAVLGQSWVPLTGSRFADGLALRAEPAGTGSYNSDYDTLSAGLEYRIRFDQPGSYAIWIRGDGPDGSSDSVHFGLNGEAIAAGKAITSFYPRGQLDWSRYSQATGKNAVITIPSAGVHTFNVWMRETGFIIDRVLLTKNTGYTPSGAGPEASVQLIDGELPDPQAAIPESNIASGRYVEPVTLSLSTVSAGASIFYTLDGAAPDRASLVYDAPFTIATDTAVRAVAVGDGFSQSDELLLSFTFGNSAPQWQSLPGSASVQAGQTLELPVLASDADSSTAAQSPAPLISADASQLAALPGTATLTDAGNGQATLSWTPGVEAAAGVYTLTLIATDALDSGIFTAQNLELSITEAGNGTEPPAEGLSVFLQDPANSGRIVIEAENFHRQSVASYGQNWAPLADARFSGSAALQAQPAGTGSYNSNYETVSAALDYRIRFAEAGTYYVWIRGQGNDGSSDSIHVGLNGEPVAAAKAITWFSPVGQPAWSRYSQSTGGNARIVVPSAGDHTLNLWMRETGFIVDRVLLTRSSSYAPSGSGPEETQQIVDGEAPAPQAAKPVADVQGGQFVRPVTVNLVTTSAAASIFYTLDGSAPNENSQRYSAPLVISNNSTLRAIADGENYAASSELQVSFSFGNASPQWVSAVTTATVDAAASLNLSFNAIDADSSAAEQSPPPALSANAAQLAVLPGTASFIDNGNGTASLNWAPGAGAATANYSLTLIATDALDALIRTEHTLTLTVNAAGGSGEPTGVQVFDQGSAAGGLLVIEAEHFHDQSVAVYGHNWSAVSASAFGGGTALQAVPAGTGSYNSDYENVSARLDYRIRFTEAGTYYIWIRGQGSDGGSDSVHLGLNGMPVAAGKAITSFTPYGRPIWSRYSQASGSYARISIPSPGVHTLNLWMRETGFVFDRVLLSKSSGYVPSGSGPAETPQIVDGEEPLPQAARPTANTDGGQFVNPVSVSLNTTSTAAAIYYTLDGSQPTVGSQVYSGPILISTNHTLRAIAGGTGLATSGELNLEFSFANARPQWTDAITAASVAADSDLNLVLRAVDPDSATAAQSPAPVIDADLAALPGSASLTDNGDGSALLTWSPGSSVSEASYNLSVRAVDALDSSLVTTRTLVLTVTAAGSGGGGEPTPVVSQASSYAGIITIEAEDFIRKRDSSVGTEWTAVSDGNWSNDRAVQALPFGHGYPRDFTDTSAQLDYDIDFSQTGDYYIWIRAEARNGSSDSVHLGLNGVPGADSSPISYFEPFGQMNWSNKQFITYKRAVLTVSQIGRHTLNIWMRESGMVIDKLLLTRDAAFTPSGNGPEATPRAGATARAIVHDETAATWNFSGSNQATRLAAQVGGTSFSCTDCPAAVTGLIGQALDFNGQSTSLVDTGIDLRGTAASKGLNLSMVLRTACGGADEILTLGNTNTGSLVMQCESGSLTATLSSTSAAPVTLSAAADLNDGLWHLLSLDVDGFAGVLRLSVDGVQVGLVPVDTAAMSAALAGLSSGSVPLRLGGSDATGFFAGQIDEVSVHTRVQRRDELARLVTDLTTGLKRGLAQCETPVRIMPLGDSITEGANGSATTFWGTYRPALFNLLTNTGYQVDFVGGQTGQEAGTHDKAHEGWSGITPLAVSERLLSWLQMNPPALVLTHLGTNRFDVPSMQRIFDRMDQFDAKVPMVVGRIINRQTYDAATSEFNRMLAEAVVQRQQAGDNLFLVDHEPVLDYASDMFDAVHANAAGSKKMALVWFEALQKILPRCTAGAPLLEPAPQVIAAGSALDYEVPVTGHPIGRFSLVSGPEGATIDPATGRVRWSAQSSGSHSFVIRTVNSSGSDEAAFAVTVQ
ncbi:chitobiase/beta-hexosaminidase C-terminal domain-containing protein [Allohahella sp. A8]|uniref:chitobiase/beta-hexosaminidase C-terminal domain-containing protein n=1 Tax=Allohahella sp. A8 TaxID=3141461 RepID=UPI003A812804